MGKEQLDRKAIGWLVDCTMADARHEKVSRFSEYVDGKHPKDLTMDELLALNPATQAMMKHISQR